MEDQTRKGSVGAEEVSAELGRILAWEGFAKARRLSRFLEYVVGAAVEGREVKESLIGVEVYGRDASYDSKADSIVRVEAGRLRSKLREYYEGPGKDSGLRIQIPKGAYEAAFERVAVPVTEVGATVEARSRRWMAWVLAGVGLLLASALLWWAQGRTQQRGLGVAPLAVAGRDQTLHTLAGGVTSDLREALVKAGLWRVLLLPEGVQSGVEMVLKGSLSGEGNGMALLELQLVNAADGSLVWSRAYRQPVTMLLESGKDLGMQVAEELGQKTAGIAPPARSVHYAKARELVHVETVTGMEEAVRLYERAIASDEKFSPAWAGLAYAHMQLTDLAARFDTPERLNLAREAARRAIALDDHNGEAHAILGRIYLDRDWNFRQAVVELRRAVVLDPASVSPALGYSRALSIVGDLMSAAEAVRSVRARLPGNSDLLFQEGAVYFMGHKFERMEAIGQEMIANAPTRTAGYWLVGLSLEGRGKVKEAVEKLEEGLRQSPRDDARTLCALGHSYGLLGDERKAMGALGKIMDVNTKKVTRYTLAYCAALAYMGLGKTEKTLEWLEKARQGKDNSFPYARFDPRFRRLYEDPRFVQVTDVVR